MDAGVVTLVGEQDLGATGTKFDIDLRIGGLGSDGKGQQHTAAAGLGGSERTREWTKAGVKVGSGGGASACCTRSDGRGAVYADRGLDFLKLWTDRMVCIEGAKSKLCIKV